MDVCCRRASCRHCNALCRLQRRRLSLSWRELPRHGAARPQSLTMIAPCHLDSFISSLNPFVIYKVPLLIYSTYIRHQPPALVSNVKISDAEFLSDHRLQHDIRYVLFSIDTYRPFCSYIPDFYALPIIGGFLSSEFVAKRDAFLGRLGRFG